MRILEPKHTLATVIETIHAGLGDGTIVLEQPDSALFAELDKTIQEVFDTHGERVENDAEIKLRSRVFRIHEVLGGLVSDLTSLIQLGHQIRQTGAPGFVNDLSYYARNVRARRLPEEEKEDQQQIYRIWLVAKELDTALTEAPNVVEELSIELQLLCAPLLQMVLETTKESLKRQLYSDTSEMILSLDLFERLRLALFTLLDARIENLHILMRTLQRALVKVQAPTHLEENVNQNPTVRRVPRLDF